MAELKVDERIHETANITGTGEYTLAGAPTGKQPLSVVGANNYAPLFITDNINWEVGLYTYVTGPGRAQRTHVVASSNGGNAVNWNNATVDIKCGWPAWLTAPRQVSKSVAGSSDVTLTALEQRCRQLILTGVLTGNINVIIDATKWDWTVVNNTTGAFSVTVKTAAGTGVVVKQGGRTAVECDGTNVALRHNDLDALDVYSKGEVDAKADAKAIHGLTWSNNVADATNDIDVAAGGAMSADGYFMALAATMTKRIDAAWAAGSGNGGRMSAAALTNQVYGIWLIARSDTGVVDVGFDASLTAPTMPANYDKSRLIGWIQRVGGALRAVSVTETGGSGVLVQHTTPTLEVDSAALTTARLLSALPSAPLGIKVKVNLRVFFTDAGGALVVIQSPYETDAAPSGSATPGYTSNITAGVGIGACVDVLTNTSGQIAARASAAVDTYRVVPTQYEWGRR